MKGRFLLFALLLVGASGNVFSQNPDDFRKKFEDFKAQSRKDYEDFRAQSNKKYADFMRQAWEKFGAEPAVERPVELPVKPEECKEQEMAQPREEKKIVFDQVIQVEQPRPQPQPVSPLLETSAMRKYEPQVKECAFTFLGTSMKVRVPKNKMKPLVKLREGVVADAWEKYSNGDYDELISDCLKLREKHKLCDWAYLEMLHAMAVAYFGAEGNDAILMTAYIYCQSGYQIRLAFGKDNTELIMLYASLHNIYERPYYNIDGVKFYCYRTRCEELYICNNKFPSEQPLSLLITSNMVLDTDMSDDRALQARRYENAHADVHVNKNLIKFYDEYLVSTVGSNAMSRWTIYANTPLDPKVVDHMYPSLRQSLEGKGEAEQLDILLNFVQTAFEYEYDDKVWGKDRIFFAEETLYYPYCDCEDRSILFSRLVRDLLGLDVVLVYYPGHLSTAVKLTQRVPGDYLILNDEYYLVCDPTYINARIGMTPAEVDNASAKLIKLN